MNRTMQLVYGCNISNSFQSNIFDLNLQSHYPFYSVPMPGQPLKSYQDFNFKLNCIYFMDLFNLMILIWYLKMLHFSTKGVLCSITMMDLQTIFWSSLDVVTLSLLSYHLQDYWTWLALKILKLCTFWNILK